MKIIASHFALKIDICDKLWSEILDEIIPSSIYFLQFMKGFFFVNNNFIVWEKSLLQDEGCKKILGFFFGSHRKL